MASVVFRKSRPHHTCVSRAGRKTNSPRFYSHLHPFISRRADQEQIRTKCVQFVPMITSWRCVNAVLTHGNLSITKRSFHHLVLSDLRLYIIISARQYGYGRSVSKHLYSCVWIQCKRNRTARRSRVGHTHTSVV